MSRQMRLFFGKMMRLHSPPHISVGAPRFSVTRVLAHYTLWMGRTSSDWCITLRGCHHQYRLGVMQMFRPSAVVPLTCSMASTGRPAGYSSGTASTAARTERAAGNRDCAAGQRPGSGTAAGRRPTGAPPVQRPTSNAPDQDVAPFDDVPSKCTRKGRADQSPGA